MPVLETERLVIRPFVAGDLADVYRILDEELAWVEPGGSGQSRPEREAWLRWTIDGYEQHERLLNPPYGDRAVALKDGGELIGACGLVPALGPFGLLPSFGGDAAGGHARVYNSPEVGLFYALSPRHHGRGYATEAARALIEFALRELRIRRVVATTTHNNPRSAAVMRRAGMRIETNPRGGWLQVVGVVDNDA